MHPMWYNLPRPPRQPRPGARPPGRGPGAPAAVRKSGWIPSSGYLSTPRMGHTATLLPDRSVLVVGGYSYGGSLASVERYDTATATWGGAPPMQQKRGDHSAVLLPDGRLLVAGGYDVEEPPALSSILQSVEIYDPTVGTWSPAAPLNIPRAYHSATRLLDGRVCVIGGQYKEVLQSVEIYDPNTRSWALKEGRAFARQLHSATQLLDGRVLVVGGYRKNFYRDADFVADVPPVYYQPQDDTGLGLEGEFRGLHTAIRLFDTSVLVAGGLNYGKGLQTAERFDPASRTLRPTANLLTARGAHTATLLSDGAVLVAGGYAELSNEHGSAVSLASTELYQPDRSTPDRFNPNGTWTNVGDMTQARGVHTATLLPDGSVLAVGGFDSTVPALLDTSEVFLRDLPDLSGCSGLLFAPLRALRGRGPQGRRRGREPREERGTQ
jgi:hypothetical protein